MTSSRIEITLINASTMCRRVSAFQVIICPAGDDDFDGYKLSVFGATRPASDDVHRLRPY